MEPAKLISEQQRLKTQYQRLFKTSEGEAVLEDLRKRFYDGKIKQEQIERDVGKRDVILHILNQLKE